MGAVLFLVYIVAGFWAVNKVLYANKVVVYSDAMAFFIKRGVLAFLFGFVFIPIALVQTFLGK